MGPRNRIVTGRSPSLVRCRSGGRRLVAMLVVSCLMGPVLIGCAVHKQVQYFAATDPKTGAKNYYRMTITGSGGWGTDYHIQAGYFSAAAVDMLRGSMPDVPILDLSVEQLEVFDRLTTHFFAALIQEAKRIHNVTDCEAMEIATLSGRNTAVHRLGQHEVSLARAERELARAKTRVEGAKTKYDDARKSWEKKVSEVEKSETEASERENLASDKTNGVGIADDALDDSKDERKDAEDDLRVATDTASEMLKKAEDAEALAAKPESSDADKRAAIEARAKSNEAAAEVSKLQTSLDRLTKSETEADDRLSTAKRELADANLSLERAKTRRSKAIAREAEAIHKLRIAELELASARRAEDRAESEVKSIEVDVARNEAARDAANTMLEAVRKKCEFEAFSALPADGTVAIFDNDKIIKLARMVWFGSLSSSDLASIGMTENTNPYQFRKLVFWATATNIDLNEFAGEIDGIIDNIVGIASSIRTQQKQSQKKGKARRKAMDGLIDGLPLPVLQRELLRGFMDISNPSADDDEG